MEKVQKELGFWQKKLDDTVGRVLNDDNISSLQKVINLFMDEAENVNTTLEQQKKIYRNLKDEK